MRVQEEYLNLVTEWRMTRGIETQTKAFLDGFNEVSLRSLCIYCTITSGS
jgi:hypothetical protein